MMARAARQAFPRPARGLAKIIAERIGAAGLGCTALEPFGWLTDGDATLLIVSQVEFQANLRRSGRDLS